MTVNDVYKWLDSFAPFETQDDYDNAGLLVGRPDQEVHGILFALDATPAVVTAAIDFGAELVVTHHPLMFEAIKQLRFDNGEGTVLKALAVADISLIAAHTNLDICDGGVADSLAEALSLQRAVKSNDCPYLRTGTLPKPCTAGELLKTINKNLSTAAHLYGDPDTLIKSVAVVPGGGGSEYIHAEADAYVTGEIHHHEVLLAINKGLTVFEAGHYPTEFPGIAALYERLLADAARNGWAVNAKLYTQPSYPMHS